VDTSYLWPVPEIRPEQVEGAPIYSATFCGFNDVMEKLIEGHPENLNLRGGFLGTALHTSSRRDHFKVIQSHGADVNAPGRWGQTPLLFASEQGNLEVLQWLLEHGTDVNVKDEESNWTSLHLAAHYGHLEIAQTLLKHNSYTEARNNLGCTRLHEASTYGHVDIVWLLLNHGTDPDACDKHQKTSLHDVSSWGNLDIVRLLLEHGASVDAENENGRTEYELALSQSNDRIPWLLLAHRAMSSV
jgi:ankyrin repeat protein